MLNFFKKLFDKNKPYKIAKTLECGFLTVSNNHKLYYELSGNRLGIPVVILHGGPGGDLSHNKRTLFDPSRYFIIQYDQRGCGKSLPSLEVEDNTTDHLIEDLEKLRDYLKVDNWVVSGSSWGSTLALAYAIKHKKRVSALLLNGIFLASKAEMDAVYSSKGPAAALYPDQFEKFIEPLTKTQAKNPLKSYIEKIDASEGEQRENLLKSFIRWEFLLCSLKPDFASLDEFIASEEFNTNLAALELHYFRNNCFVDSQELLEGAKDLKMPVFITQGRYDLVCNPTAAYQLHKAIKQSKLVFTFDAHSIKSFEGKRQLIKYSNQLLDLL
jgi:proline iminopeptidase